MGGDHGTGVTGHRGPTAVPGRRRPTVLTEHSGPTPVTGRRRPTPVSGRRGPTGVRGLVGLPAPVGLVSTPGGRFLHRRLGLLGSVVRVGRSAVGYLPESAAFTSASLVTAPT
ncbi:hypothetical protein [Streptomyces sp. Tu102]|uniref:hypothetical protein n=1 Tax=Streptomyces TaxID=1883 RepID=UPI001BDBCE9D|nr:hypothetical protein [Streptomyces sp. Tu102]MBT1096655.1 hypothetical protein [Streptomyces sp. Tu102]